jgi:hypothetical protein
MTKDKNPYRKFNRNEPLGKNGERLIWGVGIVIFLAIVAKCSGVMPE